MNWLEKLKIRRQAPEAGAGVVDDTKEIAALLNQTGQFYVNCTRAPNPSVQVSVMDKGAEGKLTHREMATIPHINGAALESVQLGFVKLREDADNAPEADNALYPFVVTMKQAQDGCWDIDRGNSSDSATNDFKDGLAANISLGKCRLESFTVNRRGRNGNNLVNSGAINTPTAPAAQR
jgi:hypothetical protein